ncbi:very long chain fatty acid elongase AAEL008004-like isoform X2 [Rhodnius prolixus]|uniref:Elongation of very long chain fatty acids protein n=1 Tax=Rhodnius prolixus TaxID=13249 RepID=R4G3C3_RHOPR
MNGSATVNILKEQDDQQKIYASGNVVLQDQDVYQNVSDINKWFMMESPWPVIGIASFYLFFVLKLGPNFMSNKKAYSLKPLILFYNLVQVVFSSWWSFTALLNISKTKTLSFMECACRPHIVAPELTYEIDSMAWYYLMSKFVELLDTVFFVLRRKQNQITFLHVYHHTNMAVSTWAFTKFVKGIQTLPIGLCNTFVHILMYGYYLLAALGPKVHKYLWWKKYITRAQISQFLVIIIYLVLLMSGSECTVPNAFIIFAVFNTSSFLILFYKFYMTSYKSRSQKLATSTSAVAAIVNNHSDSNSTDNVKMLELMATNNNVTNCKKKC